MSAPFLLRAGLSCGNRIASRTAHQRSTIPLFSTLTPSPTSSPTSSLTSYFQFSSRSMHTGGHGAIWPHNYNNPSQAHSTGPPSMHATTILSVRKGNQVGQAPLQFSRSSSLYSHVNKRVRGACFLVVISCTLRSCLFYQFTINSSCWINYVLFSALRLL